MTFTDKYPQWLKLRVQESGAHTFTKDNFDTPVISGPNSYYIMEVLKIYCDIGLDDGVQLVTIKETGATIQITKNEQSALLQTDDDDLIFFFHRKQTMLTSGAVNYEPIIYDLTDGGGRGPLIADKEIWLNVQGDSDIASAVLASAWILYRMVKVSANELLDMLQDE